VRHLFEIGEGRDHPARLGLLEEDVDEDEEQRLAVQRRRAACNVAWAGPSLRKVAPIWQRFSIDLGRIMEIQ
jgi:hypothetical protein